jgi:serine/threonine-protein kinase
MESPDPLIGRTLDGKYRLEASLGAGAMGAVYRALHVELKQPVAIKVVRPQLVREKPQLARRFKAEAQTASQLDHPNTVRVFDFGQTEDGYLYLVMELVEGEDLEHRLERRSRLPRPDALRIAAQIARALARAHRQGVIHRDLKPANVLITNPADDLESGEQVKVCDFGLAKLLDGGVDTSRSGPLTEHGAIFGTPSYMAPEQAKGDEVDPRTDIYSFGVVMYRMLAGQLPFHADTPVGMLMNHILEPAPPLPADVPADTAELVMQCLHKEPGQRPADMHQIVRELECQTALGRPPTTPSRPPVVDALDAAAARPAPRAKPWNVAAALAALALAALATTSLLRSWPGREMEPTEQIRHLRAPEPTPTANSIPPSPARPLPAPTASAPHPTPLPLLAAEPRLPPVDASVGGSPTSGPAPDVQNADRGTSGARPRSPDIPLRADASRRPSSGDRPGKPEVEAAADEEKKPSPPGVHGREPTSSAANERPSTNARGSADPPRDAQAEQSGPTATQATSRARPPPTVPSNEKTRRLGPRFEMTLRVDDLDVTGGQSQRLYRRALTRKTDDLKACLRTLVARRGTEVDLRLPVRIDLGMGGALRETRVDDRVLPGAEACITEHLRRARFPKPDTGSARASFALALTARGP